MTSRRLPFIFPLLFLGVPFCAVLFGIIAMAAGFAQRPVHANDAAAFARDASCRADFWMRSEGVCTVVPATLVDVGYHQITDMRGASELRATLRFADGTTTVVPLAGKGAHAFARAVYPGTSVRVQRFHETPVRIAAGDRVTDTTFIPAAEVASDTLLPIVGGIAIFVGTGMAFMSLRFMRRVQASLT